MTEPIPHPVITHHARGSGPPVVLLNGLMMSIAGWGPFATRLEAAHRVVRADFRGQLLTPGPARGDYAANALDVVQLLDQLGLERVHLLGASYGAGIALLVAARWPARAASLTLVTGASRFDSRVRAEALLWRDEARRVLAGGDRGVLFDLVFRSVYAPAWCAAHAEDVAARREQFVELPDEWFLGLVGLIDAMLDVDLTAFAEKVRCPALVVAAELDALIPPASCRGLAERIVGAEYAQFPGAGHGLVSEQPDRLAALCLGFLARHS
jgi:pimeloyl-ACP methyl ester carboxylesterase